MVEIGYAILEGERLRLSRIIDKSTFETEVDMVDGQIELVFNNRVIGFVDKEIPWEGESLMLWLTLLNQAIIYLHEYGFATIYEPETGNFWIQLEKKSKGIELSRIIVEPAKYVNGYIEKEPKNKIETLWTEYVNKEELFKAIIEVTDIFIEDVLAINELMICSEHFIELKDSHLEAKSKIDERIA